MPFYFLPMEQSQYAQLMCSDLGKERVWGREKEKLTTVVEIMELLPWEPIYAYTPSVRKKPVVMKLCKVATPFPP